MSRVEQMYDSDPQHEWERAERHPTEFAVTKRALTEYLPEPPAEILDFGGGPGRYAIHLAAQGYSVTLADLSAKNLKLAQKQAKAAGVTLKDYVHANALDRTDFDSESFDVVLLMGPLYHLLRAPERRRAIAESLRMLKPEGLLVAAFITRFAPFRDAAVKDERWILDQNEYAERVLRTGVHDQGDAFVDAYFAHPDEIVPFMNSCRVDLVQMIGCEGVVSGHEDRIKTLSEEEFEVWADLNYRFGKEPSLYGAADHLLYFGTKRTV